MPDPDRPLEVEVPQGFQIKNDELNSREETMALVRALMHLSANLDEARGSPEWRADVFRDIYRDVTGHNHAGTGSEAEKRLHNAAEVIARILGVRQAE